jgi:hypothetical protein
MDVTTGEKYQLQEPTWATTYGQGDPPACLTISRSGATRAIPWGAVVKASDNCDPDGQIANMDAEPPLVRTDVIQETADQFEHVPTKAA